MSTINYDVGQVVPIRAVKGQTDTLRLTITEPDGSASNLSGNSFSLTVHSAEAAPALQTISGSIAGNVVTFVMTSALNALLEGRYVYRVMRTGADSSVVRILRGQLTVAF